MSQGTFLWSKFTPQEKKIFIYGGVLILALTLLDLILFIVQNSEEAPFSGGVYREAVIGQPVNINPIFSAREPDLKISAFLYSPLDVFLKNITSLDGEEYILELKDDVKWSDGKELTSDDVVFTIDTIQNPETRSPLYPTWRGVKVEKKSMIQVKISLPNPNFVFENEIRRLPIIPKHIFATIPPQNIYLSQYQLAPVSNGPFKFAGLLKRKDGFITKYILERNEFFKGNKPFIDKVEFVFFESIADVENALKDNKVDAFGYFSPFDDEILKDIKGYLKAEIPVRTYFALFFNSAFNSFLKNKNFREALIISVDRGELEKRFSLSTSSATFFVLAQKNSKSYDLTKAQEIISSIKEKNKIKINLTLVIPPLEIFRKVAEVIKSSWLLAGVDEVDIKEVEDLESVLKSKVYDAIIIGNTLKFGEDIFNFWHSSQIDLFYGNIALYQNREVDILLENIRKEPQKEKRMEFLRNAVEKIVDDDPALFIFEPSYVFLYTPKLQPTFSSSIAISADLYQFFSQWFISKVRVIK